MPGTRFRLRFATWAWSTPEMREPVTSQDLMRYLDGELSPDERLRVERALAESAALREELATFRSLRSGFHELTFIEASPDTSIWHRVAAHVARPPSRVIVMMGVAAWVIYGIYVIVIDVHDPWARMGVAAVAIGILTLFAAVIRDGYRSWSDDP